MMNNDLNHPNNVGMKAHRMCNNQEKTTIQGYFEEVTKTVQLSTTIHSWFNMYFQGKHHFFQEQKLQDDLMNFCQAILDELFTKSKLIPVSIGFMNSPKNTHKNQQFHKDYQGSVHQVFIPLVPMTTKNSTQYLDQPLHPKALDQKGYGMYGNDIQLLELINRDFYVVHQTICKAFMILTLHGATIHRGIGNREDHDRPVFYIMAGQKFIEFEEPAINTIEGVVSTHNDD